MHVIEDNQQMNMQGDLNAVIVVTEASQTVKVHTWAINNAQIRAQLPVNNTKNTLPSDSIITHATTIDSFYQEVKFLLPVRGSDTFAIFYERTIHMVLLSQTENQLLQEVELFTGLLPSPSARFPQSKAHQPVINCAALNFDNKVIAVASTSRGTKLSSANSRSQDYVNKVTLTFYEIFRRQKISAIGAYNTVAEVKHLL